MKKIIQTSLLLLALLLPATAFALDIEVNGIYYQTDGDKAMVTNQNYNTSTSWEASNYSGHVIIPATFYYNGMKYTVTKIGSYAFDGSGVTSVTIPNTVWLIGEGAFQGCTSLPGVTIPNSVTHIGSIAFSGCSGLTSVTIPNSVTFIGGSAFSTCSNLTSISIPNSVTFIGSSAFSFCSGLTKVNVSDIGAWCNIDFDDYESNPLSYAHHLYLNGSEVTDLMIPNSVTSIGDNAFYGCSGLTSVTIPNSVTSIGYDAFYGCSGLASVTIPNSVTHIGDNAFSGCTSLSNIVVANDNPNYDSRNNCNAIIETASNKLIAGCKNTVIPNLVTSIDNGAFSGCSSLTSIDIPNSVTSIGAYAFYGCSGLTSIDIPNSVTSIGYDAFSGCTSLNDVYSNISDPSVITMGSSVFYRDPANYVNRTLHVPIGSVASYQADSKWSRYFGSIVEMDPILTTSIELNETEIEVTEGETVQLTATVLPEDATDKTVTWASSDESVASVDENGLVTAVAPGAATITAMANDGSNLSASCNITVLQGFVLAESIQLNVTTVGLNEGASLQLTATVLPEECDNKNLTWSSNNPSIATVDSNGLVTTHGVGTATITAITTDGSNLSTTCTVTLLPVGVKGDVNGDNNISIADVAALIDMLLSGSN